MTCKPLIPKGWKPGGIAVVGDMPTYFDTKKGEPFCGRPGTILDIHLREAGLRREKLALLNVSRQRAPSDNFKALSHKLIDSEIAALHTTLDSLKPGLIVALGNEANWALVPDWPGESAATATDIQNRRGYVWDSPWAPMGVLSSMHPSAIDKEWVPWSPLLALDLRKAKELHRAGTLIRPERQVRIVTSKRDADAAVEELRGLRVLACDIENYDERNLACVGFAGSSGESIVFPTAYLDTARQLLEDPKLTLIFQNGMYDVYFLLTRNGIEIKARLEDTILQWHALSPELAGAKAGPKEDARRRTAKSLAFLASLHTLDAWWKDYDFHTEEARYVLNGKDCCLTYEIWDIQRQQVEDLNVSKIYRDEVDMIWPLVKMQARGMRIDEQLRRERIEALEARLSGFKDRLTAIVVPMLEERREQLGDQMRLFEQTEGVCECCRHASKKQQACWGCAGFDKAPSKKMLVDKWFKDNTTPNPDGPGVVPATGFDPRSLKKSELEDLLLENCKVCNSKPRREWLEFNPNSSGQIKLVLYDLLKLPKKFNGGKLTADERALKDLLGKLS